MRGLGELRLAFRGNHRNILEIQRRRGRGAGQIIHKGGGVLPTLGRHGRTVERQERGKAVPAGGVDQIDQRVLAGPVGAGDENGQIVGIQHLSLPEQRLKIGAEGSGGFQIMRHGVRVRDAQVV